MNRYFALLILCGAALSACSEQSSTETAAGEPAVAPSEAPSQANQTSGAGFDAAYADATDALAVAAANRNVWSKTETLLEQSKAANSEGRTEAAIELANEAKIQAELATDQALAEKDEWRSRILTQ
jgi:hypothetical protein